MKEIIATLITVLGTAFAASLSAAVALKKSRADAKTQSDLVIYRMEQLEKKVEKHNNFDGRLIENDQRIKTVQHQLVELKEEVKRK
jgi:hypothetical protein